MPANALEIRGLVKSFKTFTLGPLDLTVPMGAIYGLVGPNGSGKTTTIDLIFGMGEEDAGSMTVLGLDHKRDERAMKSKTGYVSPELSHTTWRRVSSVISFVKGFYPTWDDGYCDSLLESLRVGRDERVMSLSFGARIKLSLVLALSWRPAFIVLDEPTVGLDAISKQHVFRELLAAVQGEDRAVLIASNNISDLERFADHVGMINNGRLLFEGATADIVARYRLVDLTADHGARLDGHPGVMVQQRDPRRWRVLLDRDVTPVEGLSPLGITPLADSPVSLEELFVVLGDGDVVRRLLRHLVWRNRFSGLQWPVLMYLGWAEVARLGGDVTLLVASSMVVAVLLGPQFGWGLDSRELRVLPVTHRDRWVTTWLLSTLVVTAYLFVVKSAIITMAVVSRDTVLMPPETLLLSTVYDFIYAGALLPAGALFYSVENSRAKRPGRFARSAFWMLFAPYMIGAVVLPFVSARALPTHVGEFTIGHVLVLAAGLTVSWLGLRWTPRAFGSLHYHVNVNGTTPGRPVPRRRFGDRFTGVAHIAWRHATKTFVVASAGLATAVAVGALFPTQRDFPRFLSVMFLVFALMIISMVTAWAPWARRLKVLPLSVTQVNALFLLTPLLTWLEVWTVLLLAHAALRLPIGLELGPGAVLAYGGISALTNALVFRVYGSRTGQFCVFLFPCAAPLYIEGLRHVPQEWIQFILLAFGLFTVAAAALVNHRTLTRSTSGSLAYQRPF